MRLRPEGVISPGDHERFSDLIQRDFGKIGSYDERTSTICLRSMGGSYNEALKIAELMYSRGISTAIEYGSECFSACALIFMAGIEHQKILPFRKLSLGVRTEKYLSRYPKDEVRIIIENSRTHDTVCELYPKQLKGDTGLTFLACSFDYWSGRNFGDCREYKTSSLIGQAMFVPRFFALAPETPLKSFGN